jgi:hypothetical protein
MRKKYVYSFVLLKCDSLLSSRASSLTNRAMMLAQLVNKFKRAELTMKRTSRQVTSISSGPIYILLNLQKWYTKH